MVTNTEASAELSQQEVLLQHAPELPLFMYRLLQENFKYLKDEIVNVGCSVQVTDSNVEKVKEQATQNSQEIKVLNDKLNQLQSENDKLLQKVVNIEAQSCRNNLLLIGVEGQMIHYWRI